MPELTDTQSLIDLAQASTEPQNLGDNLHSIVVPAGGEQQLLDLQKYAPNPRRKTGTIRAHDANAFTTYVTKHGLPGTEIWADEENARVVAVINAHEGTNDEGHELDAGWADHRALLTVRRTDAWNAWLAKDGKWMRQDEFAEHIEDRAIDIAKPSGADVLELAQSITATVGVTFESSKRLSNGERQLEYKETIDAKAGNRGRLEIPEIIELGLIPFQGAPAYKVRARFRYRINGGNLALSYALERPADIIREAFADVVTLIAADLNGHQVLMGWPE